MSTTVMQVYGSRVHITSKLLTVPLHILPHPNFLLVPHIPPRTNFPLHCSMILPSNILLQPKFRLVSYIPSCTNFPSHCSMMYTPPLLPNSSSPHLSVPLCIPPPPTIFQCPIVSPNIRHHNLPLCHHSTMFQIFCLSICLCLFFHCSCLSVSHCISPWLG